MKALLDLLIAEKDCIRNIADAEKCLKNLSEPETERDLAATQEQLKLYWTNRQAETTHELHSVQAEIGQALAYYLRINQKEEEK